MASTQDPYAELRALEREFFRIDDDVVRRIRKLKPRLMEYAKQALDTVFDHLKTNPIVADYFADEDNLAFLTSGMLAHCDRVLSARFDADYYEAVSQMGLRHSKLDYPSFVYTAAYSNMLTSMQHQAAKDRKRFSEAMPPPSIASRCTMSSWPRPPSSSTRSRKSVPSMPTWPRCSI